MDSILVEVKLPLNPTLREVVEQVAKIHTIVAGMLDGIIIDTDLLKIVFR